MTVARIPKPANDGLMGFGERLREARDRAGLSQEALAHRVGVGWKTIQRYERGDNEPTTALARSLADVLDCDIAWLVMGDPHPNDGDNVPPNLKRFLATELGKSATPEQRDMLVQMVRHYHGDTTVAGWRTAFTGLFEMRPDDPDEEELEGLMKVER